MIKSTSRCSRSDMPNMDLMSCCLSQDSDLRFSSPRVNKQLLRIWTEATFLASPVLQITWWVYLHIDSSNAQHIASITSPIARLLNRGRLPVSMYDLLPYLPCVFSVSVHEHTSRVPFLSWSSCLSLARCGHLALQQLNSMTSAVRSTRRICDKPLQGGCWSTFGKRLLFEPIRKTGYGFGRTWRRAD